jgi:RNA polymerase sigma-70 factor, ECF subfamily
VNAVVEGDPAARSARAPAPVRDASGRRSTPDVTNPPPIGDLGVTQRPAVADPVVEAAMAGDPDAFGELVARHRAEVHRHCSRMLRSAEQAEDVVQETFLRAWRARQRFAGRAAFRTWLYQIATNACLDEIARSSRRAGDRDAGAGGRARPGHPRGTDPVDVAAPGEAQPDAVAVAHETIELALLSAFALLPPRQRSVLLLSDVLRWPAGDTATLLGTTVPSVNSALQRARARLGDARPDRDTSRAAVPALGPAERARAQRCVAALTNADWAAVVDLVRADALGVA